MLLKPSGLSAVPLVFSCYWVSSDIEEHLKASNSNFNYKNDQICSVSRVEGKRVWSLMSVLSSVDRGLRARVRFSWEPAETCRTRRHMSQIVTLLYTASVDEPVSLCSSPSNDFWHSFGCDLSHSPDDTNGWRLTSSAPWRAHTHAEEGMRRKSPV